MSVLYQTLEDLDNVDYVEANGPFPCSARDRWLGKGYYYWDTFISSAHYWGRVAYSNYNKNYIIAKSEITLPSDKTLNLLETADLLKFKSWVSEYEQTFPNTFVTVEKVLKHAENIMKNDFPYVAIRAIFNDCINNKRYQDRISPNGKAYLDLQPPIQICIRDKSLIGTDNFKVIYPINYSDQDAYTF